MDARPSLWLLLALSLILLPLSAARAVPDPAGLEKVTAPGRAAADMFGWSAAVDSGTAVIGAPGEDSGAGAAYVFVRADGAWTQLARLTAADRADGDAFGCAVALDGGTAVVGACGDDDQGLNSGSVYVFVRTDSAWPAQGGKKIVLAAGAAGDEFGHAVSVSGDTAVIGALGKNSGKGAAYVFTRQASGWSQPVQLAAAQGAAGDNFGDAVAVDGGTAVIGATGHDGKGLEAGAAYVFVRSAAGRWSEQQRLTAKDGDAGDGFGGSVAVDSGAAVIGADGDENAADLPASGSAYVFVRSAAGPWEERQKLTAQDGDADDRFGGSAAISGGAVLIGAWGADDAVKGADAGAAYLFVRSGEVWKQQARLAAPDGAAGDSFGWSAALDGDAAAVGACSDDQEAGAAYLIGKDLAGLPWLDLLL